MLQCQSMNYTPFEPMPPRAPLYANAFVGVSTHEFTGWRDETLSWKKTCYLHAGLNPCDTIKLKGPDVMKFLSRTFVNNIEKFPVGSIKHGIMCDEQGRVIQDGVLIRAGEDEVETFWFVPKLPFALKSGKYGKFDVEMETLTGKVFLFQIAGPASIDTLEAASGQSLRELKFLRITDGVIAGKKVRICRVGMAGTLAYEVHGAFEDLEDVYDAILEAGEDFGIRRLGSHCYPMNHAENGFPQFAVHFSHPKYEPDLQKFSEDNEGMEMWAYLQFEKRGSAADDEALFTHNPFELGWGKMVNFNHDFVGKAALEKIKAEDKRRMVTLEWNIEDVADVFTSQFRDGEEAYKYIEQPAALSGWFCGYMEHDRVVNKDGKEIGVSFGRQNSAYFRRMISICCLDTEYTELGTEVMVVWGEPSTRQKKIRAKVARFTYNNIMRNEATDVATLPKAVPSN